MYWKNKILLLVLVLAACRGKETSAEEVRKDPLEAIGYSNPLALIEASELMALSGEEHVKIIDFRERSDYDKGHIPGAIPMWRSDIESKEQEVPGIIAPRESVESLLSGLGISSEDTLVLYDDQGGVNAARLWWVLRVYGFENVRLLNGGLHSWLGADAPVTLQYTGNVPGHFEFSGPGYPGLRIERDSLMAMLDRPDIILIDVRTGDEFAGKRQKKGAMAAGRIPGSLHIDWADAINYHGDLKFRSLEALKKMYKQLPDDRDAPVITYCHSGVRSAHTTFVLTQLLGYRQVHNYDGSWLEWSSYEGAPVEKDSLTTILN